MRYGRDIRRDPRLLSLLELLVDRGARLSDITKYEESALRVLSHRGRSGCGQIVARRGRRGVAAMSALTKAVADSIAGGDMEVALRAGSAIEDRDFWQRTPLLVAILTGEIDKARSLLDRGADRSATGRCGTPPLFYAIQGHHEAMLRWLLSEGFSIVQKMASSACRLYGGCRGWRLRCRAHPSRRWYGSG